MSAVSRTSVSSPSSPDPINHWQAAAELEQNPSVGCLCHLFSAFVYDLQTRDSGLGLIADAQNILINGGTFVSHFQRLHKSSIFILVVFTRSMFSLSILKKGR